MIKHAYADRTDQTFKVYVLQDGQKVSLVDAKVRFIGRSDVREKTVDVKPGKLQATVKYRDVVDADELMVKGFFEVTLPGRDKMKSEDLQIHVIPRQRDVVIEMKNDEAGRVGETL